MAIKEVHILHHTHVDVGYTDLQPVIWEKHVDYLEQVLEYCRQTDDYPEDAQFRWVSEFSWPVVQFLKQRPEQAPELIERIQQGRIELAGLFLDPTELMDKRALEMALKPALELARTHGFPITTVMTSDIPGQGWSLPDVMAEHGVPYLSVSPNAMVSKPLQIAERPFWWIGPRGGKVLVWHTDWRKGWYGACHVLGIPQGMEVFGPKLLEYLRQLEAEGYTHEALLLHYAADNYPPSAAAADLVRQWNDEVEGPRLRLSTNQTFFERLIELHGTDFPSYQLAWPDWWSEGLGSAAYESALSRETHCRLRRLEALQAKLSDTEDLWPIWEDLLLFDEHTWGCSNMGVEPHSYHSRASWVYKTTHIYRAHDRARRLEEKLTKQLAPEPGAQQAEDFRDQTVRAPASGTRRLSVFNALDSEFRGVVILPGVSAEATSVGGAAAQYSAATPLRPAGSWAVLSAGAGQALLLDVQAAEPGESIQDGAGDGAEGVALESEAFRLEFGADGRLLSLFSRPDEREMLDTRAPWGFGEVIRETITSAEDRAAVWERGYSVIPYAYRRSDANFQREGSLANSRVVRVERGPVYDGVLIESELPFLRRIEVEYRLWRELPWLEIEVRLDKQAYEKYEGIHVAFPFRLEHPRALVHSCDAVFEAETQQLPGTCRDYYAVQDYAAMVGEDGWGAVCPVEALLMEMGAITFGRWSDHLRIDRACLYSWLANNFWYTNFPGYQLGELTFRFAVAAGAGAYDAAAVARMAEAVRVGLSVAAVE